MLITDMCSALLLAHSLYLYTMISLPIGRSPLLFLFVDVILSPHSFFLLAFARCKYYVRADPNHTEYHPLYLWASCWRVVAGVAAGPENGGQDQIGSRLSFLTPLQSHINFTQRD